MPAKPPTKTPNPLYRKRLICSSLALICLILATTIFALSTRAFLPQRHTTSPLHLVLYIASCAPLCTYLGILCGWLYYRRKRNKYGRYEATMRRQGRGYWIDPSDAEDKKKVAAAKKLNAEPRTPSVKIEESVQRGQANVMWVAEPRKEDFDDDGCGKENEGAAQGSAPSADTETTTFKRLTNLNPFGWGLGNLAQVREPERAMSRTDSIRSARDDPVVEKGVMDIWLSGTRGSGSSYGSRRGNGIWD
ncbi:hypothetical protein FB567DRAFT_457912 [Paraphoma chrysanthemicola]|uniref:Uncharacterized protein n=1 Tax=Paraphoma chrysanthemicola TaxID=798071 RepID=A0A8K0QS22_9PLEO|nr:hypothetical protein FB567DRAFT_457912 [Paraphoma chrysanthemicola]